MKVLKFGGSSVGNPERIKQVAQIIKSSSKRNKIAVVCSALQGITDELILCARQASNGDEAYLKLLNKIEERHISTAKELLPAKLQSPLLTKLKLDFNELEDVLHGVFLIKELSSRTLDFIVSFGERLSNQVISARLNSDGIESEYLDTRSLIKTDENYGYAKVDFRVTNKNIKKYFEKHKKLQVITGFIASTTNNKTTTLGRGGSDYTASIFGAALNAKEIVIWTDVDGVLTADPRKVKRAYSLNHISYEEAMELSHFGAKVIHPPTMQPALDKKIPVSIRNTFNPQFKGTYIGSKANGKGIPVKGISSIDNISLLRVQGSGMVGVAGIAQRIFGALARENINIILITQASSEHSICFAVSPLNALHAKKAIETELKYEIREKSVNEVIVENDLSIIAVVGEKMRNIPGIAGKVFQSLGKNGINVSAIAQGSSELNISVVVSKENESKALNSLHEDFFIAGEKTIRLFLAGPGLIGKTLLNQIRNQLDYLYKEYSLRVLVLGVANSRKMIFNEDGLDWENLESLFNSAKTKSGIERFIARMKKLNKPNSIFVDCTASDEVVKQYKEILKSNISIVTPNKKGNTGSYKYFQELREAAVKHNVQYLYETNVGAGLPILGTLKDLISSGDKVYKIEGILSGTLSYIFNSFTGDKKFSDIVKEAKEKGYTEPDPREDLNGADVGRKLLILAREAGFNFEMKDIKIESLIPAAAKKAKSIDEFFEALKKSDDEFDKLKEKAVKENKVLRYVASFDGKKAETKLISVDKSHPFYTVTGTDNVLVIYSRNYKDNPMVIKGPGAGADVTAAGVFADVIRIANYLNY